MRFCGIAEERGENWQQCRNLLTKVIRDKLNMEPQFERVHRVGKPSDKQPRDIVAKFTRFVDRDAVFRDRRKFKGTNIFVNEDLCKGSQAVRQQQMDDYHTARREGKVVYWNYRTLVIKPRPSNDGSNNTARQSPSRGPQTTTNPNQNYDLPRPLHSSQDTGETHRVANNVITASPRSPQGSHNRSIEGAIAMTDSPNVRQRKRPDHYQAW